MQTLQFERLGRERLSLQGSLQCGLQDDLGRIWLGTSEGLVLWDGRQARRIESDPRRADGLSHPFIQALLRQDDGRLLVATAGGLDRLDRAQRPHRTHCPAGSAHAGAARRHGPGAGHGRAHLAATALPPAVVRAGQRAP
ncbi:MAG: hypothetical protein U1E77_09400 [Inhella sp.]